MEMIGFCPVRISMAATDGWDLRIKAMFVKGEFLFTCFARRSAVVQNTLDDLLNCLGLQYQKNNEIEIIVGITGRFKQQTLK